MSCFQSQEIQPGNFSQDIHHGMWLYGDAGDGYERHYDDDDDDYGNDYGYYDEHDHGYGSH